MSRAALVARALAAAALACVSTITLAQTLACSPAAPRTDPGTSFAAFGLNEQMLARGGNAGPAWEWALGTDTEAGQKVQSSLDWVSGRTYSWTLSYSGAGGATLEIRDAAVVVLSLSYASGMDAGNALQLQVSTNSSIGADTTISAGVSTINGQAAAGSIAQTGNNQEAAQNLFFYYPPMSQGLSAAGTVSLSYVSLPTGGRVQFKARTGNVTCTNVAPTVSLSAPGANQLFHAPAAISVAASAADSDGSVSQVEFFANGNSIGSATSAPFGINWNAAAGSYSLTARATDNAGDKTTSAAVPILVNAPPTVSLTSPAPNASFTAPASIALTAQAADSDGSVASVEFYFGSTLITTVTAAPYSFTWSAVPQGTYALTARATDERGAMVSSSAVNVTVGARVGQIYYIHADHLNTPRLVADATGATVWRWDQQEPFGNNPPDENPSGLGLFEFPLRFEGTYADKETGLLQNWHRELDRERGQYLQSDPLGLRAGLNTYAHVLGNPLSYTDAEGLLVQLLCRPVKGLPIKSHCFVWVSCPQEGWDFTLSQFGNPPYVNSTGYKRISTSRDPTNQDNPNSAAVNYRQTITPSPDACNNDCAFEKSILNRFDQAPSTMPYGGMTNNSNTFAQDLITSGAFGTSLPSNVPPSAPGFVPMVGGRIK